MIQRMLKTSLVVCISLWIAASPIEAQDTLSKQQDNRRQLFLSIEEAIQLVLQNNLDVSIEQYNPQMKKEAIVSAEAVFDSTVTAGGTETYNEAVSDNSPQTLTNFEVGLGKRFSSGGAYQLDFSTGLTTFGDLENTVVDQTTGQSNTVTVSPDTQYSTSLELTLSQALMKNKGRDVNTTQIKIAHKNYDISLSQLRATVLDLVSNVKTIYWNLVLARGDLEAKHLALQLAYDLVKINEAQVNVGTLAPIEVLQAKATAASREVDIISAEQSVHDIEDQLKRLLNIPDREYSVWDAAIIPTDIPQEAREAMSLEESIASAMEYREELQQLKKGIEIQELLLSASENQLSPELNAFGKWSMSGTDTGLGGSLGEFAGLNEYAFTAGVNFSMPLGNQAARSSYNQTRLQLDQSKLSQQNLEQLLMVQVRQAVRNVDTSYKLVDTTRIALQLAQEQLDAEQKKFNEGLSTNFQVLNYQEQLASARTRHTSALTGYNQAIVALEKATGQTLQRHRIVIEE